MSPTLPILILSARDAEIDIVSGLRVGADDYLTKDASLPHLAARIGALLRRAELASTPSVAEDAIERGPLALDVKRMSARWRGWPSTSRSPSSGWCTRSRATPATSRTATR